MAAAPEKLAKLRHLLAERFPSAQRPPSRALLTGLPTLDDATGGLPLGAITEIVCTAPSCGGQLLLEQLLAVTRATRTRVALVDSADSFDPASYPADLLAHLVWVRGGPNSPTDVALAAADLLTRDANLGLVVLDLRQTDERALRRTPASFWYRLQRAVEPADLALVVVTPRASVPSAQLRLGLGVSHAANASALERTLLFRSLAPSLQRQRVALASGQ